MKDELQSLRIELRDLRRRFLNGEEVHTEMMAKAEECAAAYNAAAREVARKFGRRPVRMTAERILRSGEFIR
jgi:hypothetical protein